MEHELVKRWLKALRSGDYKQTVGSLWKGNGEDKYCCLGVLMDLEGTDDEKSLHFFKVPDPHSPNYKYHSVGVLQSPFTERVGLPFKLMNRAIEMNDGNKSFDTIAYHIEEELL